MDIRSLTLFQHLANTLHFGKTAAACYVSPSTLSRAIQRLEEHLGSQLLIRDNRSVILTVEGKKLLSYADHQIEQYESLKLSLNESQQQLSGSLNIYCSVTASYAYLPPLLEKFRQAALINTAFMPISLSIKALSFFDICKVITFSSVPLLPIAPGSSPPWPASMATII